MQKKSYPLNETQLGMYLEWSTDPCSVQYSLPYVCPLPAEIDKDRLCAAVQATLDAHPVFHTRLLEEDGEIRQCFDGKAEVLRKQVSSRELHDFEKSLPRPFDVMRESLVRCVLLESGQESLFVLECSHLIFDGSTEKIIFQEISDRYDGRPPMGEALPFPEAVEAEAAALHGEEYREAAEEAGRKFAGRSMTAPEPSALPDGTPSADQKGEGAFWEARVEGELSRAAVMAYCRRNELHPNLFFMGVFARTLSLFAHEDDVAFFTVSHGRRNPQYRHTCGAFIKMSPVLGHMDGGLTLPEYFRSFHLHLAGCYPFTHFCRDLGMRPGWGLAFQDGLLTDALCLGDCRISIRKPTSGGAGEMPVLQVLGRPDSFDFLLTAAKGRYSAWYLEQFARRCRIIAENMLRAPGNALLKDVAVLAVDEREAVLAVSRGEVLEYDKQSTFVQMVQAHAARQPEAVAVVDERESLTYGELERRADILAEALRADGVFPGGFVGLMLPRTVAFPIAYLAVQKCGAGYLPMDSEYPPERLAYILENSGAPLLITTRDLFAARSLSFAGKILFWEDFAWTDDAPPVNFATPDTPAYMIYTSGSTGKPKGVVIANRALTALIAWFVRDCRLKPGKKNLSITSFSFDASVPDLFPPLAAGGELHICSDEIRKNLDGIHEYAVKIGATGLTTSTQLGLALVNTYPDLPLEYMMLGGEKMLPFARTSVRMLNGYGPTEFTVCSSYHEVNQAVDGDIPIGRPIPNSLSLVVDKLGQPVPAGMSGELALVGTQLADGYWRLPDKTAAVFVDGPLGRMYRTGDLARYNEAGELEFLGRLDFQVKLRGFRIEFGEVEHAAASFPGMGAVAAEVRDVSGNQHLVLYYEGPAAAEELKTHMAKTLAAYMVPDFFVCLKKMPLTPNGKIDRRKLPAPRGSSEPVAPPATSAEKKIFAIVAEVLKTQDFGVTQDFGSLGLTSLGAMFLLAKLKKECGISLKMKELQEKSNVRSLAGLLVGQASSAAAATRKARPRRAAYPMTENQRGVYADWLRHPTAMQYNIPTVFKFYDVAPEMLAAAAECVLAAHPSFATRFAEKNGELVQLRRDGVKICVPVEHVEIEPDEKFFSSQLKPFRPEGEDLARGKVFASKQASYLFLDIHHTVFDGVSIGIFLDELREALEGRNPGGEEYTAFDAALEEVDYLESELQEEDDRWFAGYLDGAESTKIETSPSADGKEGEAARVRRTVAAGAIDAACRENGVTPNDWFLTAFTELLKRTGREKNVLINFVTAGRTNPDVQKTVGMFTKTLPLRGIAQAETFAEAAHRMHESVLELIDHERQSFVKLTEKYGLRPDVLFAFEGGIFSLPGKVEMLLLENTAVKTPFVVTVTPGEGEYSLVFEYDASMYAASDMEALMRMFVNLSRNAVVPMALREIPLLTEEEGAAVLKASHGAPLEYFPGETFVQLFRKRAGEAPYATAVVDQDASISYGELDRCSDLLAGKLQKCGMLPGCFAGVMLPRRLSFMVSAIAVQKCGGGYVPLDADYPAERLAYMLENSEAPVLITTRELMSGRKLEYRRNILYYEDLDFSGMPEPVDLSTPDTPAYMIYTSGSTGKPKGVVLPNRALRHMIAWCIQTLQMEPGRRIATHPSFSFDASVADLFPSLACGAELHILGEKIRKDLPGLRDYIVNNGIYGLTMSTQIGMTLLDTYPDMPLGYLLAGGEKMLPVAKTDVRIYNGYGPTEFAVCSSVQLVDQKAEGDIPIGPPVPGTCSVIVDRYGHLLPLGFPGELALIGPQMSNGYWHAPEKTAAAFVPVPFAKRECAAMYPVVRQAACMYRTGDLARYNADGTLNYMGRLDFQVKLRGFRIEIGEIENCASAYPGIQSVAAEVRDVAGAKHLVLYYETPQEIDEAALKEQMAKSLTYYMVPDFFVRMAPMPLTPNGKINRRLLPTPASGNTARSVYVEPSNDTERAIAEVYARILKMEKFSAAEDFFVAGGTSLIGIRAVVALQKQGLDVQYGDLFKYKTPQQLAAFLRGEMPSPEKKDGDAQPGGQEFDYGAYDYSAIDRLLAATPLELYDGFRLHSLGDVLLTGATGFLGIHVLRYLLENSDSTVYALIRPKRGVSVEKRLDSQYVYYFGERIPRRFRERLAFVEGDITDANLHDKLSALVIGTVFNCAAMVKHYVADDKMDRVNVGGVENLVAWCAQSGARLVHASTYSVGGTVRADSAVALDERHLYIGQESDNDYVRTKFLAERAVLAATAEGRLRGKVMRLGNLMGRESDGEFQMNLSANAFVNSLKSYKSIGAYPLEELVRPIEMSPIDRVAEAICLLARTPDSLCVFHPYNAYALDMGAVVSAMNRRGFDVDWVSAKEFAVRVDTLRAQPERAAELQGILHYAGHLLKKRKMTPAVNDWTTTVLYRMGFRWKMADENYLAGFLDMLDGLAVFD